MGFVGSLTPGVGEDIPVVEALVVLQVRALNLEKQKSNQDALQAAVTCNCPPLSETLNA